MADKTDDDIQDTPLAPALGERYLAYALSTITQRALPDVRDGLKPVHRRLLYAMRQLKLDPASGFKKCARVVGDVIGRYHPHGDQAVYDALVRLAQAFAVRYPLVDGQGNFGNIDGDNPAAMRYTESRLTEAAQLLLDGIDEDTVDFRATYDGEDEEPLVLPAAVPNLLANGAAGIAVGMATNIPPHNIAELCDAALYLVKTPGASLDKLIFLINGPDFPTGGIIVSDQKAIRDAYTTGRGAIRVRARWHVEEGARGAWKIVVTEIPYQVQKGRLIERIAELLAERKLPLLADIRDESTEDIRLVLEPKSRAVEPDLLMEQMFRFTDLENRFGMNMNVLNAEGQPVVMDLKEMLRAWLDHRQVVLVRRSRYRLGKIEHRLEVLSGYLIAYLNLDEVIRIIREEGDPKAELIAAFDLTEVQAEAILNMRLRNLRKLEEMEIKKEHRALTKEAKEIRALLKSDEKQWARIADEIKDVKKRFGPKTELGRRRTDFGDLPDTVDLAPEAFIEKEPVTVVLSEKGWIRSLRGHVEDASDLKYKGGDRGKFLVHAQTTDKLLLFASNGRIYTLEANNLPGGRGHGEPVRLMFDLGEEEDVVALFIYEEGAPLLVASSSGYGFRVQADDCVSNRKAGKQILNVDEEAVAAACVPAVGDHLAVVGTKRKFLIFPLDQVPEMARGKGVRLQKYAQGGLSDVKVFALEEGLTWLDKGGRTWTVTELDDWIGARAQAGKLPPKGFPKSNSFG